MVAIRARFDGQALIPEQRVDLPRDRTLVIHVETDTPSVAHGSFLRSVLTPTDPEAARRMIHDPESGLENL